MKFLSVAAMCAVIAVCAVSAQASVFTSSLSYDGNPDVIQDNSVSMALLDFNGIVDTGDIIGGLITWNVSISDPGLSPIAATAMTVFVGEILAPGTPGTSVIGGDGTVYFTLGAVPAAHPFSLSSLLPTKDLANGGFAAGTVGAVLSNAGGPDLTLGSFFAGAAAMDTAAWGLDATFGISTAVGGTDYWEVEIRDHDGLSAAPTPGIISLTDIDGDGWVDEFDDIVGPGPGPFMTPGIAGTGLEAAAFSVFINNITPPGGLLKVSAPNLAGTAAPLADFSLSPTTTLVQGTNAQVLNGYVFADQAIASLNPVPEPSTLLIWAGLIGLGAFVVRRRR